ncbi:MAG TPA: hypothetical protein DCE41_01500 [Cytophagales bacterium]|nr:hypothetical protein [Cytophagales bacterium]HAA19261.1 hypothetical protein [Cytophagales bacterium]HAP64497.1 hypothetical protein [Cytophagales bacterium]
MSTENMSQPPRFWYAVLRYGLGNQFHEEFIGDLEEMYEERLLAKGKRYARFMHGVDTLHLLFGFSKLNINRYRNNFMIKNSITVAWRHAMRQKQSTVLNVLGLALGITACLLIGLYVQHERSYDTFHEKADRIYRINQPLIWRDWDIQFASTGPNVAIALQQDIPEFEALTRLLDFPSLTVRIQPGNADYHLMKENEFHAADSNFFSVFTFPLLYGNPETALVEPYSLVLTEESAIGLFGKSQVLGRTLEFKDEDGSWQMYEVTGVAANVPENSHIQFNGLMSMSSFPMVKEQQEWKWIWTAFSTYALVREGADIDDLQRKIQAIPPKWAETTTQRIFNQTFEEYCAGKEWWLYMHPLPEIYLSEQPYNHRFGPTTNPMLVWIFSTIGGLILLLSCINFMNLFTAKASMRAKEVGVRKVLGSLRRALIGQFLVESFLYVLVSTLLSLLLAYLVLPAFNTLAGKELSLLQFFVLPTFWLLLLTFMLGLGLFAGSYPALYLSGFRPAETLKGKLRQGFRGKGLRNGLVVMQFTISIGLVICAVLVQKQLAYTSTFDMGFARENILQIHNIDEVSAHAEVLRDKWLAHPGVTQVGKSFSVPPNVWEGERYKLDDPEFPVTEINNLRSDREYLEVLELEFLAGRNFDGDPLKDRHKIILNESAVEALGWGTADTYMEDSPIGKYVIQAFDDEHELEVIGVVKDFNYVTSHIRIDPLMILHYENNWFWNYRNGPQFLSMRVDPDVLRTTGGLPKLLDSFERDIRDIDASVLFDFSFVDERFEQEFRQEYRMGQVLNLFTFMALVIACLGLFGLAAFSADQRMKEISIRKVLGARMGQLFFTFSGEFTKLILLAILLASPLAWWGMSRWLADFPYHTPIHWWIFVTVGLGSLALALSTVTYQAVTIALRNPIDTLKDE